MTLRVDGGEDERVVGESLGKSPCHLTWQSYSRVNCCHVTSKFIIYCIEIDTSMAKDRFSNAIC